MMFIDSSYENSGFVDKVLKIQFQELISKLNKVIDESTDDIWIKIGHFKNWH